MKSYSPSVVLRNSLICALAATCIAMSMLSTRAQLPTNFPPITITTNYAPGVANGYVFLTDTFTPTNFGYFMMVLTNDGTPIWYKPLTNSGYDFKVLPNGYMHYAQQYKALSFGGGGYVTHEILDENFNDVESIRAGNGYNAECHDFQMLPNGHALLTSYYFTLVDMSQIVSNGNPAAQVSGAILQELDQDRNVVFQWRSWDHYPFTSNWVNSTAAVISAFHVNCVTEDTDGNLMISTPNWVKKISRQTGNIMWHLGGTENQFTFVGVSQQEGTNDFAGHAIHRLPNGNVLIYNNSTFGPGATSKVHEYALDETNFIATHIWTYTPNPSVSGPSQGNAQRLDNGNTFVGWGGTVGSAPACTEVSGTNVVFQLKFNSNSVTSYRAYRFAYPPESQAVSSSVIELATGNSYTFPGTGVSLDVLSGGGGYNRVTVTNEPYAPVYPQFATKAPRALPIRIQLSEIAIDTMSANVNFDTTVLGLSNPTNITVYYRSTTGQGLFLAQPTTYNPVTGTLTVTIDLSAQGGDFGEFIFCYPDLPDLAIPPLLAQVQNYRGVQPADVIAPPLGNSNVTDSVNQQRPVLLSWSPAGLAAYYELELGTNQDFSNPLLSIPYQTDAFLVWSNANPNTTYYYHVRTWNDAGSSDWASGSFRTVAPYLTVTAPNGGENWRRGLKYFVKWQANIAENVQIDLYKSGVYVSTISTNAPNLGAYQWQVGLSLVPGSDYTIRITSTANPALFATSAAPFSIDMPYIVSSSLAYNPAGQFSFNLVAPSASQVSVYDSTDLVNWQLLQVVPVTNSAATFVDTTATNGPIRFYRFHVP